MLQPDWHWTDGWAKLWRFIAPTARKALAVRAGEAVVKPHGVIQGLFHVKLFYYFNATPKKERKGQQRKLHRAA